MSRVLAPARSAKLVLAGVRNVGKASITDTAVTGVFRERGLTTLGVEWLSKTITIASIPVRLNFWETHGREIFNPNPSLFAYFRNADIALLVYAVDDLQSFEAIDWWMNVIRQKAPHDVILLLVGNKTDLEDTRVVSREKGEAKAAELSALFFEVSALTGDCIELAFSTLARVFLEKKATNEGFRIVDLAEEDVRGEWHRC
jgi:small GTP-binding protein